MPFIYATVGLLVLYSILIFYYWQAWRSIPLFNPFNSSSSLKVSVIVAARNEEANIGKLLKALSEQTYPAELTELIVVDDHSTDNTAGIVRQYPAARILQLKDDVLNSFKKKAIETGIAAAGGDLIVTTDADCIPPPRWLETVVNCKFKTNAVCIVAPVVFFKTGNFILSTFQELDFLVLQGITGASVHNKVHSMCNGANFAYERKVFYEVNGFEGIDHIASGDDMLLIHKIWKKYPSSITFLKSPDAIVPSEPMKTWSDFISQRTRWASKAIYYDDKRIFAVLLLVYLFNLCFGILFVLSFFNYGYWIWLAGLLAAKTLIEIPFVAAVARFFGKQGLLPWFILFQPLHITYTILAGLVGQFRRYTWKGRKVK
jgi:biofilm PGA synthesis N-glycosyltransferase PgaC